MTSEQTSNRYSTLTNPFTGKVVGHVRDGIHVHGVPSDEENEALELLYGQRFSIEASIRGIEDAIRYRAEAEHYRQMYNDLLNDAVKSAGDASAGILKLALAGCLKEPSE